MARTGNMATLLTFWSLSAHSPGEPFAPSGDLLTSKTGMKVPSPFTMGHHCPTPQPAANQDPLQGYEGHMKTLALVTRGRQNPRSLLTDHYAQPSTRPGVCSLFPASCYQHHAAPCYHTTHDCSGALCSANGAGPLGRGSTTSSHYRACPFNRCSTNPSNYRTCLLQGAVQPPVTTRPVMSTHCPAQPQYLLGHPIYQPCLILL